jgi:hypothetical protein
LIETAFYLTLIAKFGQVHMPDYALQILDISYNLKSYYSEFYEDQDYQSDDETFYAGEERTLIEE